MKSFTLQSIGKVRGGDVVLRRRWASALDGIEGFSHLIVLFWLDRARKPEMKIHPRGSVKIAPIGHLATRTPHRANPIGVTVVRLVRRQGNVLTVDGLDAWDGSVILDVKPYTAREFVRSYRMPRWVSQLDQLETDPLRKYATPLARGGGKIKI